MNSDVHASLVPSSSVTVTTGPGGADDLRSLAPHTANTLQELLRVLLKRRNWMLLAMIVTVSASAYLALKMKPVYESTAIIELNKASSGAAGLDFGGEAAQSFFADDSLLTDMQTETTILQSDSLAMDVIQRLNLASQPPFAAAVASLQQEKQPHEPSPSYESRKRALLLGMFKGHLRVQPMRGTRLINVSFEDHDPNRAATMVNALIESYKNQYLQSHYTATSEASQWLTQQLEDLKRNVQDSEKKLTDFEKQTGILTFDSAPSATGGEGGSGQAHSPVLQKLDALNTELTQAEAARIEKEAIFRFTKSGNADAILAIGKDPLAASSNSAVLTQSGGLSTLDTLHQQQGALKLQIADAQTKYGANNRHLKEIQGQLQELNRQVGDEITRVANRAATDYQLALQTENSIRDQFKKQQEEANKLNGNAVELAVLSQEAYSRKKLYEDLYTKLQEANISAGIKATNITVVDPAWAQPSPVRPNLRTNLSFGLFFGVLFGIALSFVAESLDRSVATPTQVEEISGRPVVGIIPIVADGGSSVQGKLRKVKAQILAGSSTESGAWMLSRPRSAVSEACRSLRTSIMLSRAGGGPKVVLVTSSVPAEGKTTLTVNLAIAFAQHNKRVLIIEADMRRPTMKRLLDAPSGLGLSNVLTGTADFDAAVVRGVAVPTLDFLPAGPTPPLPSEILGSKAFDDLLAELRGHYDLILMDSPPATIVTDALSLGLKADGILWVARAGTVTKPLLSRATEIVQKFRLPLIGFVMNGVDLHSVDYQYGYYGYYGSNGYYEEKKS